MLSRTADHLFWMSRYMERAENTARMLDVNYQTSLLPQGADTAEQGWRGMLSISELTGLFRQKDDNQASEEYELPDSARSDGITAPEVEFVAGEIRGKVADAMQTLPERQRQVFVLREWRGLSIKETAQTLGCSENSVKQHHFRAMRALRNQLAEVWTHAQPSTS